MFALSVSICGSCNQLTFDDSTGLFSIDNPEGYASGDVNTPDTPADFDTYTLTLWEPEADLDAAPTYTLNLLTTIPNPDADFHFQWVITAEDLGVATIKSGIWTAHVVGEFNQVTYTADYQGLDVSDITEKLDAEIYAQGPVRGKISSCLKKLLDLRSLLCAAIDAAGCGKAAYAQETINYLYLNYSKCC